MASYKIGLTYLPEGEEKKLDQCSDVEQRGGTSKTYNRIDWFQFFLSLRPSEGIGGSVVMFFFGLWTQAVRS